MSLRWFEQILAGVVSWFLPITGILLVVTLLGVWFFPTIAYVFLAYMLLVSLALVALSTLGLKIIKLPRMGEAMIVERGGDPSRVLVGGEQHVDKEGYINDGADRMWFEKFGFTIIFPWEDIYKYSYKYDIEKSLIIEHKEIVDTDIFSIKDKNYGFKFEETEGQKAQFAATFTATCALVNILTFYGRVNDGFYVMRDKLRSAWLDFSSKNYDLKKWLDATENPDGSSIEGLREKVTLAFFEYLRNEKGTKISIFYDPDTQTTSYKPYQVGDDKDRRYQIQDVSYIKYIVLVTGILIKSIDIVDLNTGEAGKALYKRYINQLENEAKLTLVRGQQEIKTQEGINQAEQYKAMMEGKIVADSNYAQTLGVDVLKLEKVTSSESNLLINVDIESQGGDGNQEYVKKTYRNTKALLSKAFGDTRKGAKRQDNNEGEEPTSGSASDD